MKIGQFLNPLTLDQVSVSDDAISWTKVEDGLIYPGNVEADVVVRNESSGVVTARYVRIHPVEWHGHITMRAGVYVLDPDKVRCAAEEAALAATADAAAATAAAPHCVTVRESYATLAASFSSMERAGFDHPQLGNNDEKPCWAAAARDLNQASPRMVLPILK